MEIMAAVSAIAGRSTNPMGNGEGKYRSDFGIVGSGVIVGCCVGEGEGVMIGLIVGVGEIAEYFRYNVLVTFIG
jgi:hypothetical protein